LPQLEHFWSSDPVLGVSAVSAVMSRARFKKIVENIHCNYNTKVVPKGEVGHDRLHKLRPVINMLNDRLREIYEPSSFLDVDESMVPFKGRSSLKQYMHLKPVKRGYNVWCLANSETGYILNFKI
jgi:hypothetical protein